LKNSNNVKEININNEKIVFCVSKDILKIDYINVLYLQIIFNMLHECLIYYSYMWYKTMYICVHMLAGSSLWGIKKNRCDDVISGLGVSKKIIYLILLLFGGIYFNI